MKTNNPTLFPIDAPKKEPINKNRLNGELITGLRVTKYQPGDYTHNWTGTIIDINNETNRAQVQWDGNRKTWVRFQALRTKGEMA